MKSFAVEIRQATETIKCALDALADAMPKIQSETTRMDGRVMNFSKQLEQHMAEVERQADALTGALQLTLDGAEHRNNEILTCSQATLSELQFQDPMVQERQRAEHNVCKLQQLIEFGDCDDVSLAAIEADVGDDGSEGRETGDVDLS